MKQFHALVCFAIFFLPILASAQDFTNNDHDTNRQNALASTEPGRINSSLTDGVAGSNLSDWSKEQDLVQGSIGKGKLGRMKHVTNALVDYLRDSCIGSGVFNPSWHGEYFSGKKSPGAQMKFRITCHFSEQNADLSITANDMQPLLDQLQVNGQHYLTVRVPTAIDSDALYFADATNGNEKDGVTKTWLITTGKALPFIPVTRKEYLTEAKAELTGMVNSIIAGWKLKDPVRPAAVQEAERQTAIDQLKGMYAGSELDVRMRMFLDNYKTDEQYQSENISKETAGFVATIQLMDSLMKHLCTASLAMPAVVSVAAADFQGFEDGQGSYMLIRPNPAYFNNTLGQEKPQLFLVTWHYDPSILSGTVLDKEVSDGMNGQALQELLSK